MKKQPLKIILSLLERIFRRKELERLRQDRKELLQQNKALLSGESIKLTSFERKMIVDALIHPHYVAKVQAPATQHFIRLVYKSLKEKVKLAELLHQKQERSVLIKPKKNVLIRPS